MYKKRNLQFPADLVTFTGEILNRKLHFLCSGTSVKVILPNLLFLTKYTYKS